jgi:hypothetical protein
LITSSLVFGITISPVLKEMFPAQLVVGIKDLGSLQPEKEFSSEPTAKEDPNCKNSFLFMN